MSVDEELVAMSFEAAADVVRIILLQVIEEDDMKTTELLDIHEDLLAGEEEKMHNFFKNLGNNQKIPETKL